MKKSLIVAIVIILVAMLIVLWKFFDSASIGTATDQRKSSNEIVTGSFPALDDTTESINKDADSISVDEFDTDLNSLEGDINSF